MEKTGSSSPQARHWKQAPWAAINLTGLKYTLVQSRPNPGPPSLRLAASGNNKPRITQDITVQTGKLDEPIISPLLTLTMSLHLPAWLTFLESWVCRLKRIPLTKTGASPPPPPLPDGGQMKTYLHIYIFMWDGLDTGSTPVSLWPYSVAWPATRCSSNFRNR